ncbi:MAG: hypothetical protein ACFFCM_21335 [Promethearchaeota archaeon]
MGFRDLLLLKEEEYRIYLILIIWLIIGFTFFQFETLYIVGIIVILPLIITTYILFWISLLTYKNKLRELSRKRLLIYGIIMVFFILIFIQIFIYVIVLMFYLAIISYIIITTVFTMHYFYKLGVRIDDYLNKLPSKIKNFERWCFFFGGTILSILLLIGAVAISEYLTGGTRENVGFNTSVVAIFIVFIIIIYGIIGVYYSRQGKLYAWMGVFFVWVAIYSIYLMISIIYSRIGSGGPTTSSIQLQILLYFFSLFLLLNTIGGIITEKTEVLKSKLRIFSADTILLWLIFSIASFEFIAGVQAYTAQTQGTSGEIEFFKYIVVYLLFIPLTILMTAYGMRNYSKRSQQGTIKQLEKDAKKEGVIEESQKLCVECGAINDSSKIFCDKCGAQLN